MSHAFYGRTSTPGQREQHTIESQLDALKHWCAVQCPPVRLPESLIFKDEGRSGLRALEDRPEGKKLLQAIREGKITRLLVYDLSRLSRDVGDSHAVRKEIVRKLAIPIEALSSGQISDGSPHSELRDNMTAVFDSHEVYRIKERTSRGRTTWASRGFWTGGSTPFGLCISRETAPDGSKRSLLVPNKERIPGHARLTEPDVIGLVYKKYDQGDSCKGICEYLNARRIPPNLPQRGRVSRVAPLWRPCRIQALLRNPIYKGEYRWAKRRNVTEDGVRKHLLKNSEAHRIKYTIPPIVDRELWERVNIKLGQNQLVKMAHSKHDYLLRQLIVCGLCGRHYVGCATHYRCISRSHAVAVQATKDQRCAAPSLRRDAVEKAIWYEIEVFLSKPGNVLRDLQRAQRSTSNGDADLKREIAGVEAVLKRNLEVAHNNVTNLNRELITQDDFKRERDRLAGEASSLKEELATLRRETEVRRTTASQLDDVGKMLETLRDHAMNGTLSFETKRDIVLKLVAGIEVKPQAPKDKQVRFAVKFTFQRHQERYLEWVRRGSQSLAHHDTL